jgi:hypothetical protein
MYEGLIMTYLMRRLIVGELNLRETFRIINKYLDMFDDGEVSIPNFSHYNDEHAIRLRVLYDSNEVVGKANGYLSQLVDDGDINDFLPRDCWCYKDDVNQIDRDYCVLAFNCSSVVSEIDDLRDITEYNLIPQNFFPCFLDGLYKEVGIELNFRNGEIQRSIENNNFQNMYDNAINSIHQHIDFNYDDFTNPIFFKRFNHMLCNNLLFNPGGEVLFKRLFYRRNRRDEESEEETLQRFCRELTR